MSINPENWVQAETIILLQHFEQNKGHSDPIKAPADDKIIDPA